MSLKMSETHLLRSFITERLTAAAGEIFGAVERTIAEYEDKLYMSHLEIERQRNLMDILLKPKIILNRTDPQQLTFPACPEEVPPKQYPCEREKSTTFGQDDPGPLILIKEEQFKEFKTDTDVSILNRTCLKREYGHAQPEMGESCRLSEPTSDCLSPTRERCVAANQLSSQVLRDNYESDEGSETQNATKKMQTQTHSKSVKPPFLKSEVLDTSFPNEVSLKRHLELGKNSDAYKYFCELCGKNFTRSTGLKGHMLIHTGEKPFKCIVCGKGFIRNAYLKLHLRKHSGEKPYACSVCGKQFSQLCSLKTHRMIHTGENPYKCIVCGKGYIQSANLKLHMKRHSVENRRIPRTGDAN